MHFKFRNLTSIHNCKDEKSAYLFLTEMSLVRRTMHFLPLFFTHSYFRAINPLQNIGDVLALSPMPTAIESKWGHLTVETGDGLPSVGQCFPTE